MKRILSLILCVLMVVAIIPMTVAAEGEYQEVPVYENDFSSSTRVNEADSTTSASHSSGKLYLKKTNGAWKKNVPFVQIGEKITISLTIYPTGVKKGGAYLTLNGVELVKSSSSTSTVNFILIGSSNKTTTVTTSDYFTINVTIDPATGDYVTEATVNGDDTTKKSVSSQKDALKVTVDTGLTVLIGGSLGTSELKADNLRVCNLVSADEEVVIPDTTERQEYSRFSQNFNSSATAASGSLIKVNSISSTAENGALTVAPGESNTWSNGASAYPDNTYVSFKLKLDALLEGDDQINLIHDRNDENPYLKIYAGENGNLISLIWGTKTAEIVAGEWYTVTMIISANSTQVYCNGAHLGGTKETFAGFEASYRMFKFNNESTVTYYLDDINFTTKADEAFMWVDGYQKTVVDGEGKYNVRFVAVLDDVFEGQTEIGFNIATTDGTKSWDLSTSTVYESITANYGTEAVAATDRGGKYITAAAITGIPAELGTVELVVTPYVIVNGVTIYGSKVTVSVNPVKE